jgi:single-stranded DNA-specific DHH superfamily exonuclease
LLIGFGGHESACGITIEKEKIKDFADRINAEAMSAPEEVFSQKLDIDMEVSLGDLNESREFV